MAADAQVSADVALSEEVCIPLAETCAAREAPESTHSAEATLAAKTTQATECGRASAEKILAAGLILADETALRIEQDSVAAIVSVAGPDAFAEGILAAKEVPVETASVPAAESGPARDKELPGTELTPADKATPATEQDSVAAVSSVAGTEVMAGAVPEAEAAPIQIAPLEAIKLVKEPTLAAEEPPAVEPILAAEPAIISEDARRLGRLRRQIEFYFSDRNLARDQQLREEISRDGGEGWVAGAWFLACPKVAALCSSESDLVTAFAQDVETSSGSTVDVEVEWATSAAEEGGARHIRLRHRTRRTALPLVSRQAPGREGGHVLVADCARLPHRRRGTRSSALIVFSPSSPGSPGSSPPSPAASLICEGIGVDEDGQPDQCLWGTGFRAALKASLRDAGVPGRAVLGVSEPNSCAEAVVALGPFSGDSRFLAQLHALDVQSRRAPVRLLFGAKRNQALQLLPSRVRKDLGDRTGCGKRSLGDEQSSGGDTARRRC